MKNFCICFLLILISALIIGCHKQCVENQIKELKFSKEDLSVNPYDSSEKLVFKSPTGDSIILSGGFRQSEINTIHKIDFEEAFTYYNGCQGDYFTSEHNYMSLHDSSVNTSGIHIELYFHYAFNNPTDDKGIWFIFSQGEHISSFYGRYLFNHDSLFNEKGRWDSIVAFHKQINIGSKSFTNIYELYSHNPDSQNSEWFKTAYYSIQKGFCGVRSNFGTLWYIAN